MLIKDVLAAVKKSPYVGVGLDESTDRSSEKHVVFIIRYMDGNKINTTYLKIEKINDGKAATIYDVLVKVFLDYAIPVKKVPLTYWGLNKMANTLQMTFLNAFLRKMFWQHALV